MIRLRSLSALLSLAIGATLLAMLANPSHAAVLPTVPCVDDQLANAPKYRRHLDHTPVTDEMRYALDKVTNKMRTQNNARIPNTVYIPVHAKVIEGTHRSEKWYRGSYPLRLQVRQLNIGFTAQQNLGAPGTRYRFYLKAIKRVTNDRWYHAALFDKWDKQAKRTLHSGGRRTLNLFINGGSSGSQPVLGWARFPWQQQWNPKLDSVTIHHDSLSYGGKATHYNRGDTAIHEVGHWLGLFHTFQSACDPDNDMVPDTPAEQIPSFACAKGRDTCPHRPGYDPVTNFMDYSYDRCMNQFTPGQVARMDAAWAKWRM